MRVLCRLLSGILYKGVFDMKIAGLDVGQARIGIAISDEMEILASSVESYHRKGEIETDARAVSEN